jgi:hypothetical protein
MSDTSTLQQAAMRTALEEAVSVLGVGQGALRRGF